MASNDVTVTLRLRDQLSATARKARTELKGLSQSVEEGGKSASRSASSHDILDRSFSKVTSSGSRFFGIVKSGIITLSAFAGAQGLAGLGVAKLASDLVESQQKFNVVFGDQAGGLQSYLNNLHKRFGFFTGDLEDSLAMFGTLGRSIDLTGKPLADFSSQLQNVALDLSSLFNKNLSDVDEAIASALEGMPRPLRDMGIFISETAVKARGALHGWTGELTDQQKVLLRSEEILDQFNKSAARGDLARTANSPANQLRQMTGRLKELGAIVGGVALAPLGALLPSFNRFLDKSEDRLKKWVGDVQGRAKQLGPTLAQNFKSGNLAGASSNIVDILGAPGDLKQPLEDIMVLFRDFGRIVQTDLIPAGKDIAAVLVPALDGIRRFFDLLPPGTVRVLLDALIEYKVLATVAKAVDVLTASLLRLAGAEAAAEGGGVGGAGAGAGAAGGKSLARRLGAMFAGSGLAEISGVGLAGIVAGFVNNVIGAADYGGQFANPKAGFKDRLKAGAGELATIAGDPTALLRHIPGIGKHIPHPFGDTATSRRNLVTGPFPLGAGQYVTSGYRTWGVGNDSDHAAGRAVDVVGQGLLGTMAAINRSGGYAAMHGTGSGRHLHAVGDTATARRSMVSTSAAPATDGGIAIGSMHVTVINPANGIEIERAVQNGIRRYNDERLRRGPNG